MGTQRLELELWRETARHHELDQLLEALWPRLIEVLPAREAVVFHLDLDRQRVEPIARIAARRRAAAGVAQAISAAKTAELRSWCVAARSAGVSSSQTLPTLLRPFCDLAGPVAVIALGGASGEPCGAMILGGVSRRWDHERQKLAGLLIEPLSVALRNHLHLLELRRDSESFLADKQALLSRLDRQDISESVIGLETGLREVVERVRQVAPTDAPVLIFGETGAGKEVVARQIHALSPRSEGPMVRVNCGAIPPELIDSELFGHERGSFTGASATRKGWFERADGGTLFLDEIGELPLAAQVRVLRVLQDGIIERVGAERPLRVDVRVVAATHRGLEQMVSERTFREDLWYRIAVFPIRLPPLRDRREDIPALAASFARRATRRLGGTALHLSASDIALLVSYEWPGNVRELAAVIERAAILGNGRTLEVAAALGVNKMAPRTPANGIAPVAPGPGADAVTLVEATRRHIEDALSRCCGRVEGPFGAARVLNVNPNTLRSRMRKLGLDPRGYRAPVSGGRVPDVR